VVGAATAKLREPKHVYSIVYNAYVPKTIKIGWQWKKLLQ